MVDDLSVVSGQFPKLVSLHLGLCNDANVGNRDVITIFEVAPMLAVVTLQGLALSTQISLPYQWLVHLHHDRNYGHQIKVWPLWGLSHGLKSGHDKGPTIIFQERFAEISGGFTFKDDFKYCYPTDLCCELVVRWWPPVALCLGALALQLVPRMTHSLCLKWMGRCLYALLMPYPPRLPQRSWGPGCSWQAGEICLVAYVESGRQMIAAYLCLASHVSNGANGLEESKDLQLGPHQIKNSGNNEPGKARALHKTGAKLEAKECPGIFGFGTKLSAFSLIFPPFFGRTGIKPDRFLLLHGHRPTHATSASSSNPFDDAGSTPIISDVHLRSEFSGSGRPFVKLNGSRNASTTMTRPIPAASLFSVISASRTGANSKGKTARYGGWPAFRTHK
ncbi:hypothetical protein IW262DRAFT_1296896 [Armillaria fumosa]|nr:hypothetical protein IW262DRAFT_1296896 [Armillaria fumosa]